MTHVSYQHPDTYTLLLELKNECNKRVVNDEYQYEAIIYDVWNCVEKERLILKKGHKFSIKEWTVIRLQRVH